MIYINQLKNRLVKTVLNNISLDIEEGKCTALIGKNGAEKVHFNRYTYWS